MNPRYLVLAVVVLSWGTITLAQEQGSDQDQERDRRGRRGRFVERQQDPERGGRQEGERRGPPGMPGFGGGDPEEMRQRWERFRTASPEERRRQFTERMVDMAAWNYELNDTEKDVVRREMEKMSAERRTAMGATADEYDRLRDEMFQFWARPPAEGEAGGRERFERMREDPKFQEMRRRMREIEEQHPFNWEESVKRVENLLPPEKVAKGRARIEQFRRGFEERRRDGERSGGDRPRGDDRMERRRGENRADRPRRDDSANRTDPDRGRDRARRRGDARRDGQRPNADQAPLAGPGVERPLHPWERYVQKFVVDNALSPSQVSAAYSILKDVRTRADRIESSNRDALLLAEKITDPAAKKKRIDELSKPVNDLFEELKRRCDGVLTAEQRAKKPAKAA